MSTELVPIDAIERMAVIVAKSGLFGMKSVEAAAALMMIAHAEGLHPATAALDYDIIQGRPAKKPQAMMRDFQKAGGKVEWHDYTDEKVSATFSHPAGGSVTIGWDMKRAAQAGLGGKDNWKKFPRQMLRARVISEGIRATFPGATGGMYVPEEAADMEPAARVEKDVTPAPERPTLVGKLKAAAAQVDTVTGEITPPDTDWVEPYLDRIADATGTDSLMTAFDVAQKEGRKRKDTAALDRIVAAKDAKKALLATPVKPAPHADAIEAIAGMEDDLPFQASK